MGVLGSRGIEHALLARQSDAAGAGLLDAVRLHVDVLLHFAGQFVVVHGQQAPQVAGEGVQLLQVGVGEGQHLRQERIEAHVVGKSAAEFRSFVLGKLLEPLHDRVQQRVEPVLGRRGAEVGLGEAFDVVRVVDRELVQARPAVVQQVGIGGLRQQRGLENRARTRP